MSIMAMKLLSIQVGLPREVQWQGRTVTTGIFKERVEGPVMLRTLNLEGDAQADLTVHGGMDKAVRIVEPPRFQERNRRAGIDRLHRFLSRRQSHL